MESEEWHTFVSAGSSLALQREEQHTGDWAVKLEAPARQNLWNEREMSRNSHTAASSWFTRIETMKAKRLILNFHFVSLKWMMAF